MKVSPKTDLAALSERFNKLLDYFETDPFEFSKRIGDERSERVKRVLDGKGSPSFDMLSRIKFAFPSINLNWLVQGYGDMVSENFPLGSNTLKIAVRERARRSLIPYVSAVSAETYIKRCKDPVFVADLPVLDDVLYNDAVYRDFEVYSESSSPIFGPGDVVRGRYLDHSDLHIHNDQRLYVVVCTKGIFIRSFVLDKDKMILTPVNKEFDSFEIEAKDILEIWRVIEARCKHSHK